LNRYILGAVGGAGARGRNRECRGFDFPVAANKEEFLYARGLSEDLILIHEYYVGSKKLACRQRELKIRLF
jgi:hypothetical protein